MKFNTTAPKGKGVDAAVSKIVLQAQNKDDELILARLTNHITDKSIRELSSISFALVKLMDEGGAKEDPLLPADSPIRKESQKLKS